jgi:hypothetical protein
VEEKEGEGEQLYLELVWAWPLLWTQALSLLIGAGFCTKAIALGWVEQDRSGENLARKFYRLSLAACAAAALLAQATCSGHSLD